MMEKYYYNGKNVAIINVLQVGNDFDVRKLKLFNTRREAEEYAVGCILEDCEIIFDCYWQPNGLLVVRVCVIDKRGEVYDIDKNIKAREIWYEYFNQILFEKGIITEEERNNMIFIIRKNCRTPDDNLTE